MGASRIPGLCPRRMCAHDVWFTTDNRPEWMSERSIFPKIL